MTPEQILEYFKTIRRNTPVGNDEDQALKEAVIGVAEVFMLQHASIADSLYRIAEAVTAQTKILAHAYNMEAEKAESGVQ